MIVAVGFGNTEGDTPSVFIVDTDRCPKVWREAILNGLLPLSQQKELELPTSWAPLGRARVKLPRMVEAAVFLYYEG